MPASVSAVPFENRHWYLWERSLYFCFATLPNLKPSWLRVLIIGIFIVGLISLLPVAIVGLLLMPVLSRIRCRSLPAPRGPYAVSCSDFWLPVSLDPALFVNTLSSGDGPVGQDHFIRVRMYYPTTQSSAPNCFSKTQWLPAPARLYAEAYVCFMSLPSWFAKFTAPILMNVYSPIGVDDPPLNYPNMGTPLSEGTGTNIDGEPASWKGWPVVLFSHGLGGSVSTYGCICAEMASNGAVVFAPEHQDGSAVTTFGLKITPEVNQNTRKLLRSEDLRLPRDMELESIPYTHWKHLESLHGDGEGPWRARQICRRKSELVAIVDTLKCLSQGDDSHFPLGISDAGASLLMNGLKDSDGNPSLLNFDKISLVGHSFGGATILDMGSSLRTERVIALDPWVFALKTPMVSRKGVMAKSGSRSILDQAVTRPTLVLMTQSLMYKENEDDIRRLYSATARVRSTSIKGGSNADRAQHFLLAEVMNTRHQDQSDVPSAIPFVAKFFCMASNQVSFCAFY